MGRNAVNIRLTTNVGKAVAKECLDKKKHTRFGAKYMVKDSLFAFEGTMTTNAQSMECVFDSSTENTMEKTINSLMNTDGGYLYLGVDDQWRIQGVSTSEMDVCTLKRAVTESLSEFEP